MSALGGRVTSAGKPGSIEIRWLSVPRGAEGTARVQLGTGPVIEVSWRRDADGLWLQLPSGPVGFDFEAGADDEGRPVYRTSRRGSSERWDALAFQRSGEENASAAASGAKKPMRVRAQMPGKILRVLVRAGAEVKPGQPLLVMEAMKMENEIKAQAAGKVRDVKVVEGQAVETGADLLIVDPI